MKHFLTIFSIFNILVHKYFALDFDNYTLLINHLSSDGTFLDNYSDWSLKLFSHEGYIYGNPHGRFPCPRNHSKTNSDIPTSVHKLQPGDFKCIGALGDGLTTGLATQAITPTGLLFESRGKTFNRNYSLVYRCCVLFQVYRGPLEEIILSQNLYLYRIYYENTLLIYKVFRRQFQRCFPTMGIQRIVDSMLVSIEY